MSDFKTDDPSSYVVNFDANNLYGYAMSKPLPYGHFSFFNADELKSFDFDSVDAECDKGYICEVDLFYGDKDDVATKILHDKHNDYPLASESLLITKDMLSPFCESFGQKHFETRKLCLNLNDKVKCVLLVKNLQLYKRLGITVGINHRVLRFSQSAWMKKYTDVKTKLRQAAFYDFEKDLFKLMNNACFGKTMENVKLRKNIELLSDARQFLKLIAKSQLGAFKTLNENTVLVNRDKETVLLDKPICAGFCILDLSKVLMYEIHYDVIVTMYGDNARLLFTDTDSLCYHIQTVDVYLDMLTLRDSWLDTSAFQKDHVLYSETNKKVPGFMKFEGNEIVYTRFIGMRAKIYSLVNYDPVHSKMTAKDVKKNFIKNM